MNIQKVIRTTMKYQTEIESDFLQRGKSSYLPYTSVNAGWVVDLIADEQLNEAARIKAEFKKSRRQARLTPVKFHTDYCPPNPSTRVSYRESRHYAWLRKA